MDPEKTWLKILDYIKSQISSHNFRTWFYITRLNKIEENKITINTPSAFIKGQLISRYESLLKDSIQKVTGKQLEVEFTIDPSLGSKDTSIDLEEEIFQIQPQHQPLTTLNPKYKMENFVVGLTNNLAYAASQAIIQNPGISYNPLFLYGPSGVGKTHLMQAIGNSLITRDPTLKLVFAPSERFMVDFVDSLQYRKTADFRQKYRNCQALLIDDIQFIAGKDSTQEEFFHTFNELYSKNSQIVLTSDRPPNEMVKLESRLLSRFQGGLMVDIQLPDFDTRVAILKAKLLEKSETLPEEVLSLIAESVQSNTRELEGKLIQILQMLKLTNQPPNIENIKQFLGKYQTNPINVIDHKKVLGEINQYFNIKMTDLTGPRRQKNLVLPRQIAMFILYEDCKLPMEKIGQLLGGRDHTTILYGIEKIRDSINRDREIQRLVIELKGNLST